MYVYIVDRREKSEKFLFLPVFFYILFMTARRYYTSNTVNSNVVQDFFYIIPSYHVAFQFS